MTPELPLKHLAEIFQDVSSWPAGEQVHPFHIGIERDPKRCPAQSSLHYFSKISYFNLFNAGLG
jgi:hypothetical protein